MFWQFAWLSVVFWPLIVTTGALPFVSNFDHNWVCEFGIVAV